jgi:phosphopentomutase
VLHMGTDLDRSRQLPTLAAHARLPVTLVGKMADVIDCPEAESLPCVPTREVLTTTLKTIREKPEGLIGVNVQEIDLAGHQQDPARCAHILSLADQGMGRIVDALAPDDLLIVLADHGNDPTIGHPFHTREYVPILAYSPSIEGARQLQERRATLGDVGATAAAALGLPVDRLEVGIPIPEAVHGPAVD